MIAWTVERWESCYTFSRGHQAKGSCVDCSHHRRRATVPLCVDCGRCWRCCEAGAARLDREAMDSRSRHTVRYYQPEPF